MHNPCKLTSQRTLYKFGKIQNKALVLISLILLVQCLQVRLLDFDLTVCRCEKVSHFDKPFAVLWNSPTGGCHSNFNVNVGLEKFGILTNTNQTWNGEVVTVFYNGQLGLYPYFNEKNLSQTYNGGLPQLVNITEHLLKSTKHIIDKIPDPGYSGVAVIDWERWRPSWDTNFGIKRIYQTKSIELVEKEKSSKKKENSTKKEVSKKGKNHLLLNDEIAQEAKKRFEKAARKLMEETIKLGRKLRPKALWGFYGFPACHGNVTTGFRCRKENKKWNDELHWLYESSTALFPSIYLMEEHVENNKFVKERLREAFRVASVTANNTNKSLLPVLPYLRPLYRYGAKQFKMLNEDDLENAIGQTADFGCAGLILWGNHYDEKTSKDVCKKYNNYINKKLGPYVSSLTEELETCSEEKCSNNGRCIDKKTIRTLSNKHLNEKYSCRLSNITVFNIRNKTSQQHFSGFQDEKQTTSFNTSKEKLVAKPSKNTMTDILRGTMNKNKTSPTKTELHNTKTKNDAKQQISHTQAKQLSRNISPGIKDPKTLLKSSNTTRQKQNMTNSLKNETIDGLSNILPLKSVLKNIHQKIDKNNSKAGHISHIKTKINENIHTYEAVNRSETRPNNASSVPRVKTKRKGYSASSSDETAVHIPGVYIILITVTLGGALLMTVIYVAIYYAVNVQGRSHDHTYHKQFDENNDNPFAIDDQDGLWWNEKNEQKQKLLNKNNKR